MSQIPLWLQANLKMFTEIMAFYFFRNNLLLKSGKTNLLPFTSKEKNLVSNVYKSEITPNIYV